MQLKVEKYKKIIGEKSEWGTRNAKKNVNTVRMCVKHLRQQQPVVMTN